MTHDSFAGDTAPFSSSVHPPESYPQSSIRGPSPVKPEGNTPAESFRHSGWQRTRDLIRASLWRLHVSESRLVSWDNCGYGAYILQDPNSPQTFKLAGSNCHDRFCMPCARLRAQCIANAIKNAMGDGRVRFVTLTLRHSDEPLSLQLDRLYASFTKLRRQKAWSKSVKGGCAICEVKRSARSDQWHPHLHVLTHGKFLNHIALKQAWHKATGDSNIVDIRLAQNQAEVAHYITKYVTKVTCSSFLHRPDLLDEVVQAMHGRKLALTFGDWRGVTLTRDDDEHEWVNLGSFNDWFAKALAGDIEARLIMTHLCPDFFDQESRKCDAERSPPVPPDPPLTTTQLLFQTVTWTHYDALLDARSCRRG